MDLLSGRNCRCWFVLTKYLQRQRGTVIVQVEHIILYAPDKVNEGFSVNKLGFYEYDFDLVLILWAIKKQIIH